jgi:hypothetical protein
MNSWFCESNKTNLSFCRLRKLRELGEDVVERKWHNELCFLQVFIYVFCDVFKARGVCVCVCIKTTFCASFWKQELCVVASWDLSRSQQRMFTRRKGCQLALSFQCWSVVWVTLTKAQSSTKPSHKGLPTDWMASGSHCEEKGGA